jgi:hypothetical protein
MHTRIATLSLLLLAGACASANPRPPATPPTPPAVAPPPVMRPVPQPTMPPPTRPVSSDPGVRTLEQPAVGGLIAETEPEAPTGATAAPTPSTPRPPPEPTVLPGPQPDDGLGEPPAGPLAPVPAPR